MSLSEQYNVGSRIHAKTAIPNFDTTQSSAAAATTQDGVTIDRQETGLSHYYSCKAVVSAAFTAGSSNQTAVLAPVFQHSSDGTSWESFSTASAVTATLGSTDGATTGTTDGTEYGVAQQKVNLRTARRYLRVNLPAPTFSGSSSGTLISAHGIMVFGGADENPPS